MENSGKESCCISFHLYRSCSTCILPLIKLNYVIKATAHVLVYFHTHINYYMGFPYATYTCTYINTLYHNSKKYHNGL